MKQKTILAFLQNMWVKNPERVKAAIARGGEEFRIYFMRYALFAGCKTGRNIRKAFGDELIEQIIFEETTREIAGDPKTIFPADLDHIRKCIEHHRPQVVLGFGKIAENALTETLFGQDDHHPIFIFAHHPACRNPASYKTLTDAAEKLRGHLR